MSNDKVRAEFEEWVAGFLNHGNLEDIVAARSTDSNGEIVYRFDDDLDAAIGITAMWIGWQASRAALVVELPPKGLSDEPEIPGNAWHNTRNNTIEACRRAIEAAGVRVKV